MQALADRVGRLADVVEPRQRREALEPEDAFEERRRAVADRARRLVAARLRDQAALEQVRDGRVRGDAADARDVRPRARSEVRDDRERLERGLREVALRRLLEEPRTCLRCVAEDGREGELGAVQYRTTPLFERVFGLESLAALPRLDDLGADTDEIRARLETVAAQRTA